MPQTRQAGSLPHLLDQFQLLLIPLDGFDGVDVEEDFAQESSRGDIFSLGSMPWRVLGISKNRFLVEAAPGVPVHAISSNDGLLAAPRTSERTARQMDRAAGRENTFFRQHLIQ